ncbi:uncharacterized protein [Ambystoma mexicanum]|uniref:uncharacterized protein n=1 Tax=Ambystoma mexicanum TaxID=8296 RepID=UPI0037E8D1E2
MQNFDATKNSFIETQASFFLQHGGTPTWFHGEITRNEAEALLKDTPPGSFLMRYSETRVGYSLSYKAIDRCRHFMIDSQADGRFVIVGVHVAHKTLEDLIKYHQRRPIIPYNEVLTQPCVQRRVLQNDYGDQFQGDEAMMKSDTICPNEPSLHLSGTSHTPAAQDIGPRIPPVVPPRSRPDKNRPHLPPRASSCDSSPELTGKVPLPSAQNEGTRRLYPSIAEEMSGALVQDPASIVSGLYPWKNKMKHGTSCDSVFDQKPAELQKASASLELDISTGTCSERNQKNWHVNKLFNPAKEFKNKVLPVLGIDNIAMNSARNPHNPMLTGKTNKTLMRVPITKNTTQDSISGSDNGSERNQTTNQMHSAAFWGGQVQRVPNPARGGQGNAVVNVARPIEVTSHPGLPREEYKRPPPFAPGF